MAFVTVIEFWLNSWKDWLLGLLNGKTNGDIQEWLMYILSLITIKLIFSQLTIHLNIHKTQSALRLTHPAQLNFLMQDPKSAPTKRTSASAYNSCKQDPFGYSKPKTEQNTFKQTPSMIEVENYVYGQNNVQKNLDDLTHNELVDTIKFICKGIDNKY